MDADQRNIPNHNGIMLSISHRKDALIYYIENMGKENIVNTLKDFVIKTVEVYW